VAAALIVYSPPLTGSGDDWVLLVVKMPASDFLRRDEFVARRKNFRTVVTMIHTAM
jgi:hypothetical protein